ncbi:MAG: hypothetical protein JW895_04330 [Thermoleophilaceae bacterium]|nr:hypothetical protein [Thermoleophilaceae bacterium]
MSPRERARRIRQTVAALAVAAFLALFAGIYVQMATGHDPALGASAAQTAASDSGTTSAASDDSAESDDSGGGYQPASVSTGQS